ncbi:MAG TPA: tetratricopeptide repeat protein [Geminicoccaceae bacterium]|nr:tetratricopeptide repeat protein [Geminicoccaceae bacterium]
MSHAPPVLRPPRLRAGAARGLHPRRARDHPGEPRPRRGRHGGRPPYESGRAALARGDVGLAVEQFRRELHADPGSVRALNGLAIAYDELGRFDVARAVYERALHAAPDAPDTMNNLGRSLLRQGAPEAALPYLVRAREAAPPGERAVIEANLAEARAAAGAPPAPPPRVGAAGASLERVGARTHLLRAGDTAPRRLVAAYPLEPGTPPAAPARPAPLATSSRSAGGSGETTARAGGAGEAGGAPGSRG